MTYQLSLFLSDSRELTQIFTYRDDAFNYIRHLSEVLNKTSLRVKAVTLKSLRS